MDEPLSLRERQNMAHGVHEAKLSALHTRGQDLYRQKEYEAALECFTKAIDQDVKASLTVLDNRAATHTKLGNHRAALNDGRQMIRQEKDNCLGYLRSGQILQLMDKHEMALDLYERGICKVSTGDPNIMLLRGQHEKLARKLAPPRTIDPLQMLPFELVEMTIKYLSFGQLVRLLRVSKPWLQLLSSMPGLWNDLDFSTAKKPVTLGAVRQYIQLGKGNTTRIILDRFGYNVEKIPRYVATRCRALNDLRLSGGFIGASILEAVPQMFNLKTLIISSACEISCDVVSQLLSRCLKLEHAEFPMVSAAKSRPVRWETDMPNLRTLVLGTPGDDAFLALDELVSKMTNIQTLSLRGWDVEYTLTPQQRVKSVDFSNLVQLQVLNISRLNAVLPPRLPPTIRTLAMKNCASAYGKLEVNFADFDLPLLTRLSLVGWEHLILEDIQACLEPARGKVTHLNISGSIAISSADLGELIRQGYLDGVEHLVLKSCDVDDGIAILIAKNLPDLKNLDLAYTKITGVGVKALVTGLEAKLEHLCLDECYSTNIDAVDFARAKGIKVAFSFRDHNRRGRKIIQQ